MVFPTRNTPLNAGQYIGNKNSGCACSYVYLKQQPTRRGGRQNVPVQGEGAQGTGHTVAGLSNVDLFTNSMGRTATRFYCHRGLTSAAPTTIDSPPVYWHRTLLAVGSRLGQGVKKAFVALVRVIIPRVNVGVGINLWRLNA